MTFTRTVMLEQGDTGWRKIQSIFSAVRMWGAGVHTTSAVQIALALMLTASLPRLWQSDAAFDLKASALATACLLATPYVLDYELVVLAVSIAFSRATDWPMGSAITRSAYWRRPGSAVVLAWHHGVTRIPLGLLVMLGLCAATLWRAALDRGSLTAPTGRFAEV